MLGSFAYRIGLNPDQVEDWIRLAQLLDRSDWCLVSGFGFVLVGFALMLIGAFAS